MDRYLLELDPETMRRLDRLKSYPEEPYDRIINRLVDAYGDADRLTREEVSEIREALRRLKEGRFVTRDLAGEETAPGQKIPPASVGDPEALKNMEEIFSGAAEKLHEPEPADPDSGSLREIDPLDKRGRSRTPHLDNL